MKLTILSLLILLVSCGKMFGEKNNSGSSQDPLKGDGVRCLCLPETNITIISNEVFPAKIAMLMDGKFVLNECQPDHPYVVSYMGRYEVIRNERNGLIKGVLGRAMNNSVDLEIINCRSNASFFPEQTLQVDVEIVRDDPAQPRLYRALIKLGN